MSQDSEVQQSLGQKLAEVIVNRFPAELAVGGTFVRSTIAELIDNDSVIEGLRKALAEIAIEADDITRRAGAMRIGLLARNALKELSQ